MAGEARARRETAWAPCAPPHRRRRHLRVRVRRPARPTADSSPRGETRTLHSHTAQRHGTQHNVSAAHRPIRLSTPCVLVACFVCGALTAVLGRWTAVLCSALGGAAAAAAVSKSKGSSSAGLGARREEHRARREGRCCKRGRAGNSGAAEKPKTNGFPAIRQEGREACQWK